MGGFLSWCQCTNSFSTGRGITINYLLIYNTTMFKSKSKGFINIIAALVIGALAVCVGALIDHTIQPISSPLSSKVGAVNYVTGGGTYRLASSISSTQTSIKLSSFTEPVSGTPYTMAYLNSALE